jgi:hypothetical protein
VQALEDSAGAHNPKVQTLLLTTTSVIKGSMKISETGNSKKALKS